MSDMIVKGMEKPEKCWDCPMLVAMSFEGKSYYACGGDYSDERPELKDLQTVPDWCPAKELILCKDCKHHPSRMEEEGEDSWSSPCPAVCADKYFSWIPADDFYCGKGERKEER